MLRVKWVGLFRQGVHKVRITLFFVASSVEEISEKINSYIAFQHDCSGRDVIEHRTISSRIEKERYEKIKVS